MGNQYSITVSDETQAILQSMKTSGYKVSQVIDEAVKTLGEPGCARLISMRRLMNALKLELGE